MTHDTCRLTAKNRDQLRNPMLGNRVWATFTFLDPSQASDSDVRWGRANAQSWSTRVCYIVGNKLTCRWTQFHTRPAGRRRRETVVSRRDESRVLSYRALCVLSCVHNGFTWPAGVSYDHALGCSLTTLLSVFFPCLHERERCSSPAYCLKQAIKQIILLFVAESHNMAEHCRCRPNNDCSNVCVSMKKF